MAFKTDVVVKFAAEDRRRLDKLTSILEKKEGEGVVLVSGVEAARLLGKSPQTISKMVRQGRLHRTAIGKSIGIPLSEIRRITNPA